MKYVVLSQPSEQYAAGISRWMWSLSRPQLDDSTQFYCGWCVHPDGRVALVMPEDDSQPVHPDSDPTALVDAIRKALTADEAQQLEAYLESKRGDRIDPSDLIPESVADQVMTQKQMQTGGWFPEDA